MKLEEIIKRLDNVFNLWDTEADKIQGIFREVAKKQKVEIKYSSRVFFSSFRTLKTRLDELKDFRRQHEQLTNVIAKVLRFSGVMSLDYGLQNSPEKQVFFYKFYNWIFIILTFFRCLRPMTT